MSINISKKYIYILGCCVIAGTLFFCYTLFWGTSQEESAIIAVTQSISTKEKSYYIGFSDEELARTFEDNVVAGRFPDVFVDDEATRVFEKTTPPFARVHSKKDASQLERIIREYEPKYIEEVPHMEVFVTNDPLSSQQRYMKNIVDITSCERSVPKKLAIVDTHFDKTHEDLDMQLYYITQPGEGSHGTHVASVAAAITNNSLGISSVSQGMQIVAIDVSESDEVLTYGLEGMMLAVHLGAEVINISWGSYTQTSQAYTDFFDNTEDVVFVAAAGNDSTKSTAFPASHRNVLSVGAIQEDGTYIEEYNTGDLCAPGGELLVASEQSGYAQESGTSLSAGYISGLMAAGLDLTKYIKKTKDGKCIYIDLSICK